ncbi:uncharacterized protein LOC121369174 [Gigantopelta aegis]|uniref:uncharacterized protein LOC121369174 n=1 Tax=Gigantopelta aegis TaxID=1735272 RepID=UPI001B887C48|nr:uncharacterized protein LOC121369174 [Gigantopelta aegis]XP_041350018.1 uncharacterized protein LOC121369174 [Gigantopelta aegis]XP_041350019.1 uncharacterized protein LOC121369174 [Gigantopelta aegis]XP_041350020.1 uncharacterized protein LOC121369174 [Gigantopelta aegis]
MSKLIYFFNDSCVPVRYPCKPGTDNLADPCDCQTFYECQTTGYTFLQRQCAGGLFWNHLNGFCQNQNDIAIKQKLCIPNTPWMRCANVSSDSDLSALSFKCTGSTLIPTTVTEGLPAEADDTGAIVGGIIGGLLVVAIIVAVVIFLVKKGKPLSEYIPHPRVRKSVSNPEYNNAEEPYAEINNFNNMDDPEYKDGTMNKPALPHRTEIATAPVISIKQKNSVFHEEVAYDNPGYARDTSDSRDITISMNQETAKEDEDINKQPFYSTLDRSSLQIPQPMSYTSLRESQQASLNGVGQVDDEGYQVPTPKEDEPQYELENNRIHINPKVGL